MQTENFVNQSSQPSKENSRMIVTASFERAGSGAHNATRFFTDLDKMRFPTHCTQST